MCSVLRQGNQHVRRPTLCLPPSPAHRLTSLFITILSTGTLLAKIVEAISTRFLVLRTDANTTRVEKPHLKRVKSNRQQPLRCSLPELDSQSQLQATPLFLCFLSPSRVATRCASFSASPCDLDGARPHAGLAAWLRWASARRVRASACAHDASRPSARSRGHVSVSPI
jgi:hypothetical protein